MNKLQLTALGQAVWLSRTAAQIYSGLSRATIDRAVSQKKIESIKKGRRRLLRRESLETWIRSDEWLERPEPVAADGD